MKPPWFRPRVRHRLTLAFLIVAAIGATVGLIGVLQLARLNQINVRLYEHELMGVLIAVQAEGTLLASAQDRANYLLARSEKDRAGLLASFNQNRHDMLLALGRLEPLVRDPAGRSLLADVRTQLHGLEAAEHRFFTAAEDLPAGSFDDQALRLNDVARELVEILHQAMHRLKATLDEAAKARAAEGTQIYLATRTQMIALPLLGLLLSSFLGWYVARRITRPLSEAVDVANAIADGKLEVQLDVSATDELGDLQAALNKMAESLGNSRALLESQAAELKHQATHDRLTGLPNRSLVQDRLEQAMKHAQRYDRTVTVAFMDLDNFKLINDSLGHGAGDVLLIAAAQRMAACLRDTDTVARMGGDEFVLVLFDQPKTPEVIAETIQRLRQAVAMPVQLDGHELRVTSSMGLASYPQDGADADTLLRNADAAMYRAKDLGRNNVQFYAPEMNDKLEERLKLQQDLRNALARHEFLLMYQPQVNLRTGAITGVEALLRWQHPERGLLLPSAFIQLAEETGLIVPIGEWVLRSACTQNKAWQDKGMHAVPVSVNISARQFREKEFLSRIRHALADSGLAPNYLELEVTEGTIMNDLNRTLAIMHELQQMDVQISIDDFGTGYSSLGTLKRFPIMRLKIDRSLVHNVSDSRDMTAVAKAVIAMGHKLNVRVVAEGVETEEELEFLSRNHCDEAQGHYCGSPMYPSECETALGQAAPPLRRLPAGPVKSPAAD